jgi:hypothetical protein
MELTLGRPPAQAEAELVDARAYVERERDMGAWAELLADIYERLERSCFHPTMTSRISRQETL